MPAGLLVAGAAALPVSLAALRQHARPEVLPLLAGPLLAGAELVEVEGLPPGAGGRCPAPAARSPQPAAAPIVPGGALGASAWLRRCHGVGRPGRGHAEGLALLAGPLLAGAELVEVEGLPPGAGGRRPAPAARRGADRAGWCAGCVSLAAVAPRGRQARPWAR